MIGNKMNDNEQKQIINEKMNNNTCPVSDNYYSKCPVMRSYYYLVEEFFVSWSWSG